MSITKIMFKKILDKTGTKFIDVKFIIKKNNLKITDDKNNLLEISAFSLFKEMFIGKLLKSFPDGIFLSVKLHEDFCEGFILLENNEKRIINFKY